MGLYNKFRKSIIDRAIRRKTHGELIEELIFSNLDLSAPPMVFVETGCGVSTISLAHAGKDNNAKIYSCDINTEKADELTTLSGDKIKNVEFLIGQSLTSLEKIAAKHDTINFLFLDSAASAMYTFNEFQTVEKLLKPGSIVLIDNAAIPGERRLLSPVRKGKILVPYLLASPYWEVKGHPDAGDSMVSAIMRDTADYADPAYEDPEYIDHWRRYFSNELK